MYYQLLVLKSIHVQNVNNKFSFLHWNIEGLSMKLFDKNFVSFVSKYDFVCLVETFVEKLNYNVFNEHEVFCQLAVKLSAKGRPSGGIICLVKKEFVPFIRQIKVTVGNFFFFALFK